MLKRRFSSQSGQALTIAVLLLILMAILAAIFVAFIAHSVTQTGRRTDVENAERASAWGVKYAHQQLQTSPDQCNWRPEFPPYFDPLVDPHSVYYTAEELSRQLDVAFPPFVKVDVPLESGDDPYSLGAAGEEQYGRCLIQVSYVPAVWDDSAVSGQTWGTYSYPLDSYTSGYDELSPFIKITAIGSARRQPGLMRTKVAYVPLVLPDRTMNIADVERTLRVATIGTAPWVDVDGDGLIDVDLDGTVNGEEVREYPIQRIWGGIHSNTPVGISGITWLGDLDKRRGDRFSVAGDITIHEAPIPTLNWEPGVGFRYFEYGTGWLDDGAVSASRVPSGARARTSVEFLPLTGYVQDNASLLDPSVDDTADPEDYNQRVAQRVEPGRLDAVDDLGVVRLRRFARESGIQFDLTGATAHPNGTYNSAEFALGGTIYVANGEDVQSLEPQALHDNWRRAGAQANAYWYGPLYAPPGCDVVFHEKDIAADWDASPPNDPGGATPSQRYYGNLPEFPDITLRLNPTPSGMPQYWSVPVTGDGNGNGLADETADIWDPHSGIVPVDVMPLDLEPADGIADNVMVLDYPSDRCLYFEGNVRVRGRLPISRDDVVGADGYPLRWDVTLVSRQNIYVQGNLMRGVDWYYDGVPGAAHYVVEDRYAARAGLFAEHNVAVNATAGEYQGEGIVTDAEYIPDIAESSVSAGHWLLEPGKSFRTYFGFGGVDLSPPSWMLGAGAPADNPVDTGSNPRYSHPDIGWADDVFLKLRVRGSRLSPFHLLINGVPYDFDTRDPSLYPEAADVNPCKQMDGTLQTLYVPVLVNGVPVGPGHPDMSGTWDSAQGLQIDGAPGGLNSVESNPARGMTRPGEGVGGSIERRDEVEVAPGPAAGPASGVPILTPDGDHAWFGWIADNGPPPLVRAGGAVLHSRVMTVAGCFYAQKGSFYVIGGDFFDNYAARADRNGDGEIVDAPTGQVIGGIWFRSDTDAARSGAPDWAEDRRHNLQVQIYGTVTQNLPPDLVCVADWCDKLCFPIPDLAAGASTYAPPTGSTGPARLGGGWCPPIYAYDAGLRSSNPVNVVGHSATPFAPPAGTVQTVFRLPRVPVSPDLIYFGDLAY